MCSMKTSLPFVGMVMTILAQVSCIVVSKAAMSKGMNKYIILVYSNALSSVFFLICSLIFHRSDRPPLTFSILCRFFFLSLIGIGVQITGYIGIDYSSPALATAMMNLIPAFTFMLAIIFRMETIDWRSRSSQAKSLGTLVSIIGAFVVTFYKGSPIMMKPIPSSLNIPNPDLLLSLSPQVNWILGGIFLAVEAFLNSAWYIAQASVVKKFPAILIIMFYLYFFCTILSAAFSLIAVEDQSAWGLKFDIGLVAILYSAVSSAFWTSLITWCLSKTGPFFCSMFKPLAIIFAVAMEVIFLGDALCLGSLIGAIIIVTGFYAVMWGKAKEGKKVEDCRVSSSEKVPLLQNRTEEI